MFNRNRLDRLAGWMNSYVEARKYPGCSVLVYADGEEQYFHATGRRDLETNEPFTRDTVVRLYSMTKPITSALLMMLVEEGRLHLGAPLSEFLPAFDAPRALVADATDIDQTAPCACPTLHQVLTHRAGFSYGFNPGVLPAAMVEHEVFFAPNQGTLAEMTDKLATLPLAFVPGTRWEYSVGIDVIGRVIEVVEGKPLDAVLRARLLDPLGMSETAFRLDDAALPRFAALYTPLEGNAMGLNDTKLGADSLRLADRPETSVVRETTLFSGGGGLVGTIDDYMAFARFLETGMAGDMRLMSRATLDFMQSNHLGCDIAALGPQSFAEQPMTGMGFGIGGAVVLDAGHMGVPGSVGDFSWGGMASTFFWIDRLRDVQVVFLTQVAPSSMYPSRSELKALVHGAFE